MAGPFACLKETGWQSPYFVRSARENQQDMRNKVTATLFPQPVPIEVPVVKILV